MVLRVCALHLIPWEDLGGSEVDVLPRHSSSVPLTPGTALSSSEPWSECPLRLEKPNGDSNFCLTAITSLAQSEKLGDITARMDGPWERRLQSPSRQGLGDGERLQRRNLLHYLLCFARPHLGEAGGGGWR